jgi:hypothetical protein
VTRDSLLRVAARLVRLFRALMLQGNISADLLQGSIHGACVPGLTQHKGDSETPEGQIEKTGTRRDVPCSRRNEEG